MYLRCLHDKRMSMFALRTGTRPVHAHINHKQMHAQQQLRAQPQQQHQQNNAAANGPLAESA
jgi:hypothetical protein